MPPDNLTKVFFMFGLLVTFVKPVTVSFANFSKTVTIPQNKISTQTVSFDLPSAKKSSQTVCDLLNSQNWWGLYQVSSTEVKQSFTQEEFINSFGTSDIKSCQIKTDPFYLSNVWTKTEIEVSYNNSSSKLYYLALKNEEGNWKMFGTEAR